MALLALAWFGACSHPAAGRDYTLRGVVRQLPDPKAPGSAFYLQHEALDSFVDRDGKVSGMDSMTMPFDLAEGVSLEGIAVGDPVEITLHVDWAAELPVAATTLKKLPAETKIEFRSARPIPR